MVKPATARFWIPVLLLLVTAAVYLPTLTYGLVYDDADQIVRNQPRFHWADIPGYFTTDVWSYFQVKKTNYYRPIFLLWLMLNYQVAGTDPMLWHASTILAHLLVTLLVYFLALRLLHDPVPAGIAALLFGVHPVHLECVAWISGVTEPLFAIPSLGTILLHLRAREQSWPRRRRLYHAGSIGCFAIAMLSKETAIVLPPLLAAWDWLMHPGGIRARWAAAARTVAPYAAVVAIYLPARWHALEGFAPKAFLWSPAAVARTLPAALRFYLGHCLWPFGYSIFYAVAPVASWSAPEFLLSLGAMTISILILVLLLQRSRTAVFASLLFLLPLAPVLDLPAFSRFDYLHDRYLYLPSVGICLLAAMAIRRLVPHGMRAQAVVAIVLAGSLAILTVAESPAWRSDFTLFTHALERSPASLEAQQHLGGELMNEQRYADALPLLKQAAAESFARGEPAESIYLNIAACYRELGDFAQAAGYLHDATLLWPDSAQNYLALAIVQLAADRPDDAEAAAREALRRRRPKQESPQNYHYYLGRALETKGDWKAALAEYEAELRENPQSELALSHAAALRHTYAGK